MHCPQGIGDKSENEGSDQEQSSYDYSDGSPTPNQTPESQIDLKIVMRSVLP